MLFQQILSGFELSAGQSCTRLLDPDQTGNESFLFVQHLKCPRRIWPVDPILPVSSCPCCGDLSRESDEVRATAKKKNKRIQWYTMNYTFLFLTRELR